MSRSLIACLCLVATTTADAGEAGRYAAGLTELAVADPEGTRTLAGHIWYPAVAGENTMRFGENGVWLGVDGYPTAPLAAGRFPLVVMSHGLDGNSFNQAWLAKELAESGMVVAAPNHPGTTTWDRDPEKRAMLWERPRDISRTISAMLADSRYGDSIAADRIAVIGHSLGGYTSLALAGARFDLARHETYCADRADHTDRPDCVFVGEVGIGRDLKHRRLLEASLADTRIQAVVSLDLALTQGFDPASVVAIDRPVLILGAARGDVLDLDAESRALTDMLRPDVAHYVELPDAGHYDFLGICKPGAQAILAKEEPEFEVICDAGGAAREALHSTIADEVQRFLGEVLGTARNDR